VVLGIPAAFDAQRFDYTPRRDTPASVRSGPVWLSGGRRAADSAGRAAGAIVKTLLSGSRPIAAQKQPTVGLLALAGRFGTA